MNHAKRQKIHRADLGRQVRQAGEGREDARRTAQPAVPGGGDHKQTPTEGH